MGPLEGPLPRLRAALISALVLAALAAMAVAVPGAAKAADHSISLSCASATVDTGEPVNCEGVVNSIGSAPVATGHFAYEIAGETEYFDLGEHICDLTPVSATAASCSFPITGYAPGEEDVIAQFPPTGPPTDDNSDEFRVTVEDGSLPISCDDPVFVSSEQTRCRAFIPASPGAASATGSVAFSSMNRIHSFVPGEVEPDCQLEPVAGGAGCSVAFAAPVIGDYAVLGRYEGDTTHSPDRGTAFATAVDKHETVVVTSCDRSQPLLSFPIECTTTVTNTSSPTGPAPSGVVTFHSSGPGTFPGITDDDCEVVPITERKSECSVIYQPEALGFQQIRGHYSNPEDLFESGDGFFLLNVQKGRLTATSLACEPGKVGVFRKCTATVRDAESKPTASPVGTVTLSGKAAFNVNPCKLQPVTGATGVSRCEVGYRPNAQGTLTLRAEYEDNGSSHYPSNAVTSVSVQPGF